MYVDIYFIVGLIRKIASSIGIASSIHTGRRKLYCEYVLQILSLELDIGIENMYRACVLNPTVRKSNIYSIMIILKIGIMYSPASLSILCIRLKYMLNPVIVK